MCNTENRSERFWDLVDQVIEENIEAFKALAMEGASRATALLDTETIVTTEADVAVKGEGEYRSLEEVFGEDKVQ